GEMVAAAFGKSVPAACHFLAVLQLLFVIHVTHPDATLRTRLDPCGARRGTARPRAPESCESGALCRTGNMEIAPTTPPKDVEGRDKACPGLDPGTAMTKAGAIITGPER